MATQKTPQKEMLQMKGKLNALSNILRLGHESFDKATLEQWAGHVVNNSILVAPYSRSALVDMRGAWPKPLAISGQPGVNTNSEYSAYLANLVQPFKKLEKITRIDQQTLEQLSARKGAFEALSYFEESMEAVVLAPLFPAGSRNDPDSLFIWVVEFEKKSLAAGAAALLSLLSQHYSESLFYVLQDRKRKIIRDVIDRRKIFRPSRIVLLLLLVFLIALAVIKVRQNVAAEFEIIPKKENLYYAPFEGVIEKCFFKSGDAVKQNAVVLKYDTEEQMFNLAAARNQYNKISAELDLIQNQSFKDIAKRGRVRLLELNREKAKIDIDKNKWFLRKGKVRAEQPGILDIGDVDKLEGKRVNSGEKLFEILATNNKNLIALVSLDESNAAVLEKDCRVTLYLHTRPEMPINAELISVSPKPVLTDRKMYCYLIRVKPLNAGPLNCGMRGVARVSGPRVRLGYYLFRNLVLWWRKV